VRQAFIIRNDGDEPLLITNIRGCCGASTRLETNSIAPGTQTTFEVSLSLRGRLGNQHKSLYLESNDPKEPLLQVRFIGRALRDWSKLQASAPQEAPQATNAAADTAVASNLSASASARIGASNLPPVTVDYFYEAGCPECLVVQSNIIPPLRERFAGFHRLAMHDVGIKTNMILLIKFQERLGIKDNEPVCMVVDYTYALNGVDTIRTGLLSRVDACLGDRQLPGWKPPESIAVSNADGANLAKDRVNRFTLLAVLVAGFLDGINPCAISTLVFFMSLLGVSKIKGRGLVTMGISFCLASFLTYTALGFGLLRALHLYTGFPMVRLVVEMGMIAALGVLAAFSFRDAYRYGKTGDAKQVSLQLSDGIKERMHKVIRSGLGMGSLALGGLMVGAIVTALESVCTGQVYVPTLILVINSFSGAGVGAGVFPAKAWSYLLLYNLMFIVPLVAVFILTYFGLRTQTLLEWSRKNVVISKVLLGVFFLAMAVLIAMM